MGEPHAHGAGGLRALNAQLQCFILHSLCPNGA
jgi:hypothetical protein